MDASRFDRLVASFVRPGSRRGLLRLLAAVPVVSLPLAAPSLPAPLAGLVATEGEAAKRRQRVSAAKKKKKKCARAGQSTSKKRKKCCAGLSKNASGVCTQPSPPPGPPPSPPSCPPGGCPAKQICHNGACHACDVTCNGTPTACGTALQAALNGGASTIYVCPGRYQPAVNGGFGFSVTKSKTVIGAGQGAGSGTNTILDANNGSRVLFIGDGAVVLEQLRVTDGNAGEIDYGGGIYLNGGTLQMTDCSVVGNTSGTGGAGIYVTPSSPPDPINILEMTRCTVASNSTTGGVSPFGGGILVAGTLTLTDCLIEDNSATASGGGIAIAAGTASLLGTTQVKDNTADFGGGIYAQSGSLTIAESCRVTNNTADAAGIGGGIYNEGAGVILQGASPSPIVVNNCHENCVGTVAKCAATPVSC